MGRYYSPPVTLLLDKYVVFCCGCCGWLVDWLVGRNVLIFIKKSKRVILSTFSLHVHCTVHQYRRKEFVESSGLQN